MAVTQETAKSVSSDSEWRFLLRLDTPSSSSTLYSEEIELSGWFHAPENVELNEQPEFSILVEDLHTQQTEMAAGLSFLGVELSPRENVNGVEFLTCGTELSKEQIQAPENGISGVTHSFSLKVRFSDSSGPGFPKELRYRLAVKARLRGRSSISNFIEVRIPPTSLQHQAIGGIDWPYAPNENREIILLCGWALKPSAEIVEAGVYFGEVFLNSVYTGIHNQNIRNRLPGLAEALSSSFQSALARKDVLAKGVPEEELGRGISFKLRFTFSTGETLEIHTPCFRWGVESNSLYSAHYSAVEIDTESQLRVSAKINSRSLRMPRVSLDWARGNIDFTSKDFHHLADMQVTASNKDCSDEIKLQLSAPTRLFGTRLGRVSTRLFDADSGEVASVGHVSYERLAAELVIAEKERIGETDVLPQWIVRMLAEPRMLPSQDKFTGRQGRILFASHNLSNVEGAPKVFASVVKAYVNEGGKERAAIVVSGREGPLRQELEAYGVEVRVIPELDVVYQTPERYRLGQGKAREVIREFAPSMVYANVVDSFWAIDIASRFGIPGLFAIHESADPFGVYKELKPSLRAEFLRALSFAHTCVFVSKATKDVFRPLRHFKQDLVIPNGLDLQKYQQLRSTYSKQGARKALGYPEEGLLVCCVGTTTERKGQDTLLRALKVVETKLGPAFKGAFIVGAREGQFLTGLYELRRELGLEEKVCFVSETPEIHNYVRASDVMVIASREESAPLVSLEAFAYETALVSTSVFGLAEQIRANENALSFEVGNFEQLAEKILLLSAETQLRDRLIAGGRETLEENYDLQKSIERYLWLFEKVLSEVRQPPCQ